MARVLRTVATVLAVGAVATGVGMIVGDWWTPTRGIGAALTVGGLFGYLLVAF